MQSLLIYLALAYILLFFSFSLFDRFIKYSYLIRIIILVLFVSSLTILAYTWMPKTNDLTRQFDYLVTIRESRISLFEFLTDSYVGGSAYEALYVYNIYRYCIAKLFANNSVLPALSVAIDYSIISYILFDINKFKYKKGMFSIDCWAICFGCMPFLFATSGIRNALAACIMALAVYKYIYKNCILLEFIIYSILAIFIHPVALFVLPFVFFTKLNLGWKGIGGVLIVISILNRVALFLSKSGIEYFRRIGTYYLSYTSADQYRSAEYYLYFDLLVIIVLLVSYFLINKDLLRSKDKNRAQLFYFVAIYSMGILAFWGNYDMVLRPAYFLGAFAPISSLILTDDDIWLKQSKRLRMFLRVICAIFALYVVARYMRFFYVWSNNIL